MDALCIKALRITSWDEYHRRPNRG